VYSTIAGVMRSAADSAQRAADARHARVQVLGAAVQQAMATTGGSDSWILLATSSHAF